MLKTLVLSSAAALDFKSGSDGLRTRTHENREVFVPCGFCRTGAGRGRETKPVAAFLTHLEERLSRVPLNGLISPEQAATVPFQP